jgi:ribosomal protein S6
MVQFARTMEITTKEVKTKEPKTSENEGVRIYEVGYHVLSTVKEEEVEAVVSTIRKDIEKAGGSLITEGAPQSVKLSYTMSVNKGGKNTHYERAYFGWIKFEADSEATGKLKETLTSDENILRFLIFKTLREDTRVSARPKTLREVRRTDKITSTPKKGAEPKEVSEEVSEKDLDKALDDITSEL